jgi:hypothetical protein
MLHGCETPATWATVELHGYEFDEGIPLLQVVSLASCAEHRDEAFRDDLLCVSGPVSSEADYEGLLDLAATAFGVGHRARDAGSRP